MAAQGRPPPNPKSKDMLCDICLEPKLKAQKSCLVCLSSYCQDHLQPHLIQSGLKTHQLTEPQENLQTRACPQHPKVLDLFCTNDKVCICMMCAYSDHRSHDVVPLKEAADLQKRQLSETEADIKEMIDVRREKIKELRVSIEGSNANADRELAEGVQVLTALKESVERVHHSLVEEITRKKTAVEEKAEGYIKELDLEIDKLKRRHTEVREFLQSKDNLHILQNVQKSSVPTTKDWTHLSMCPPTYKGSVARAMSQLEEEVTRASKILFEAELNRAKTFEVDVKLDSDTAHPLLTVSADRTRVEHSPEKIFTTLNKSERFDALFVMGKESFTESFYFEVVVSKKPVWVVGVARETVERKGSITLLPNNGFWTIGLRNKAFYASDDTEVCISTTCKPKKVGVFVDRDEDLISFYDVKAATLIYSFSINYPAKNLNLICSPGNWSFKNSIPLTVGLPSTPALALQSDKSPNSFPSMRRQLKPKARSSSQPEHYAFS